MCLPDDVLAGGLRESGTTVFLLAESVAHGRLDDFSWSEITLLTLHFVSIAKYNGLNDNTVSNDGDCDQHQGPRSCFGGDSSKDVVNLILAADAIVQLRAVEITSALIRGEQIQ